MKVSKSLRLDRYMVQAIRIHAARDDVDYFTDMVAILLQEALDAREQEKAK